VRPFILVLAVGATLMAAKAAPAFQIDGLFAGQSLAMTQANAARNGMTLAAIAESRGVYTVARAGQPPHATITFCANRDAMFAYTGLGVGGFDAFTRMVEREDARLGTGRYTAATIESADGPISRVAVEWQEQWWAVSVAAIMLARGPVSASRGMTALAAICQR
jgi:hypothetical protein